MAAHPSLQVFFFYVLGKLNEPHAAAIDRHLPGCRACQNIFGAVQNDVADLSLALAPAPVPTWIRESLLHSAREVHRLSDAVPALRRALSCSKARVAKILRKVDAPKNWHHRGGVWVMNIAQPAPRAAALVRLNFDARYRSPRGSNVVVHVLQGHARSSLGPLRAGRRRQVPAKSRFGAYPGPDVLLLFTWNRAGAVAAGEQARPGCTLATALKGPASSG